MKIFQIGLNHCLHSQFINQFCIDLGMKCISWDHGNLILSIHQRLGDGLPLLHPDYQYYDFYGNLENLEHGLCYNLSVIEHIEKEYPDSKFVLNIQKSMDDWVKERMDQDPSFVRLFMAITRTASKNEMLVESTRRFKQYVEDVKKYFVNQSSRLIVFDIDDHPMNLYDFLNPIDHVYNHFEFLYKNRFHHRIQSPISKKSNHSIMDFCDVYCHFVPQREHYIRHILNRFDGVYFVEAITPDDIRRKTYRKLSTTLMVGPMTTFCNLCNYSKEHMDVFHKFTKLCVHLSYIICLRHAIEHSRKELVIIFEDDIYFDCTEEEFDRHLWEFRKSSFDVGYLGFCACRHGDRLVAEQDPNACLIALPFNQSIRCKHAIVYKSSYLQKLLGDLLPLMHNSDIQLNHANIRQKARVAMVRQPLVFQDRNRFGSFNENNIDGKELPLY